MVICCVGAGAGCCANAGAEPARVLTRQTEERSRNGRRSSFTCSDRIATLQDDAKQNEEHEGTSAQNGERQPTHLVRSEAPASSKGVGRHLGDGTFEFAGFDK